MTRRGFTLALDALVAVSRARLDGRAENPNSDMA
jgi:hypothetical protein